MISLICTIWKVWGCCFLCNLEGFGDVLEVVSLIFTIWIYSWCVADC